MENVPGDKVACRAHARIGPHNHQEIGIFNEATYVIDNNKQDGQLRVYVFRC